jgi:uncharacterized membrane protein (UPF0127 family)
MAEVVGRPELMKHGLTAGISLAPDNALLFLLATSDAASMWIKNTVISVR